MVNRKNSLTINIVDGPAEMDLFHSLARGTEVVFTLEGGDKLNSITINIVDGPAEMDFFHSLARGTEVVFTLEGGDKLNCIIHKIEEESGDKKNWLFRTSCNYSKIPHDSKLKAILWGEKPYFEGFYSYSNGRKGYMIFRNK